MREHGDIAADSVRVSLTEALTFHASFDHGPDADFALGDARIYSATVENGKETGELTPGLGEPGLTVAEGQGKFGSALMFSTENSHVVLFKAAQNVAYSPSDFGGTASFWMNLDPAEIPQRYCDPFQLTDKDYSDACIWIDFTKNDTPSDFPARVLRKPERVGRLRQARGKRGVLLATRQGHRAPIRQGTVDTRRDHLERYQHTRAWSGTPVFQRRILRRDEQGQRAIHLGYREGQHSPRDRPLRRSVR